MRKWLLLFFPLAAWALPSGNPAEPERIKKGFFFENPKFSLKVGYQQEFVLNRNMKGSSLPGPVDDYSMQIEEGVLTLTLARRLEAYAAVGSANIDVSQRPYLDNAQRKYQTSNSTAWGGGVKGILFRNHALCLAADVKYLQTKPKLKWDTLNGKALPTSGLLLHKEWQASLGVAYKVDLFSPYLSLSYSHVGAVFKYLNSSLDLGTSHFSLKNRQPFGLSLGCGFSKLKKVDLNLEFQLISENALTLSGNVQF